MARPRAHEHRYSGERYRVANIFPRLKNLKMVFFRFFMSVSTFFRLLLLSSLSFLRSPTAPSSRFPSEIPWPPLQAQLSFARTLPGTHRSLPTSFNAVTVGDVSQQIMLQIEALLSVWLGKWKLENTKTDEKSRKRAI